MAASTTSTPDFLGAGWAFPPRIDPRGRMALARQERDVEEAIHMILLTPKGQRVMRPEFGCRIHELIFAPNDATTIGLATSYVHEALGMWEPRIRVEDVTARTDRDNPDRLLIDIRYQIRATHDRRSLVFPFYRIPGEPSLAD
jgi:phage baseplate assembly protein W